MEPSPATRPRALRSTAAGSRAVIPYGRVPFVPGAAIVLRRHLRFDATLRGGEDVEFCGGCRTCVTTRRAVAHDHRTTRASG